MRINKKIRERVLKRRWQARVFIICDYHPYRASWVFFTTRGEKRAKKICKKWCKMHKYGSAIIVDPETFRLYWRANNRYI